ncbi:hypothetical protein GJ744_005256 [Endocarpon pusillum]|uniref:Uncharacterized protein n=1 Tax=Endocarpon pusillum TaxID=364733 RepID=A0A8H7DYH2_9EURO|nr:hypothetical protein GJ744_005256 [Endocarpon pusillum]
MSHRFARRTYGRSRAARINVPSATTERQNRTLSEPGATQAVPSPAQPSLPPPPPRRSASSTSTSISTPSSGSISRSSSGSRCTPSRPHQPSVPASSFSSSQATSGFIPYSTIPAPPPGRYSLRSESGPASSAETSLATSNSLIDFYSGYGGFFCSSFDITADEVAYFTEAGMQGLPLPGGQPYDDFLGEFMQAARFKQAEMDYAEGRILDEERKKKEIMAASKKGRRGSGRGRGSGSGSGSGGRRGISDNKAGGVCRLARDSEAAASGSGSSSPCNGARPGRQR